MSLVKSLVLSTGVASLEFRNNQFVFSSELFLDSIIFDLEKEDFDLTKDQKEWVDQALKLGALENESEYKYALKMAKVRENISYEELKNIDNILHCSKEDKLTISCACLDILKSFEKEESPSESDAESTGKNENKISGGKEMKVSKSTVKGSRAGLYKGTKSVDSKKDLSRRDLLKTRIIKDVFDGNLDQVGKIMTNSMAMAKSQIVRPFSDLLELVMGDVNGMSYSTNANLRYSLNMGKTERFEQKNVTKYTGNMLGTSGRVKDAMIAIATKAPKAVVADIPKFNEQIGLVNSTILAGVQNPSVTITEMELYPRLKQLAEENNMMLTATAEVRKGYKVAKFIDKDDKFFMFEVIVPEIYTVPGSKFSTGVDHVLAKIGDDLYAGSATVKVKNTLTKKYSNEELVYGKFFNTIENYLNIVEAGIKNRSNIENPNLSNIFFDSKEDNDNSRAFFLRVGSVNEIYSTRNTYQLKKRMKFERLCGTMLSIDPLAYDAYVLGNMNHKGSDELFKKMTGYTLGGGAGVSSIFFKTVNNLQRVLITEEDKVRSNSFTMNPFVQFKGSRMNNSDSRFIVTKSAISLFSNEGHVIPWNVKMGLVVFFNFSDVTSWPEDELMPHNALDSYTANRSFFDAYMTEQQLEDKKKYHTLGVKSEAVKEAVKEILDKKPTCDNIREELKKVFAEHPGLEKQTRKDLVRLVDKISVNGLKGIVNEIKTPMSVIIESEGYEHIQDWANNGHMVVSNVVLHKPEHAIPLASGLQKSVAKQMLEGKEEFEFTFPNNIKGKVSKDDMIKVKLNINGVDYDTYAILSVINVHESKNNYVAQGDSSMKQTLFNIQVLMASRGNKKPHYFKANKNLMKSIVCAGYEPIFGEWKLADKSKVYSVSILNADGSADSKKESRLDAFKTDYKLEKVYDNAIADIVFEASPFAVDKNFVLIDNGDILEFVESEKPTEYVYLKERSTISLSNDLLNKLYSAEERALTQENLLMKTSSTVGNYTNLDALKMMSSKNLESLFDAYAYKGISFFNETNWQTGETKENLLGFLSKQRVIELKGMNIPFEPSMRKIGTFFPKELNTAIRAASEVYSDNSLDNFIELIDNKTIKNLSDFFEVVAERIENGDSDLFRLYFEPKAQLVSKFDLEHNLNGNWCLKQDIKDKVVKLTSSLNAILNYHRERLFTKKANEVYFEKQDAFYGTVVAMDLKIGEIGLNPNNYCFNKKFVEKHKVALFDRKPNTGEFGYGLRIVWDSTIPENCVAVHPAILEQLMGDTDGDTAFVYFVNESIAKEFKFMDLDVDAYFATYAQGEDKYFSKWNKSPEMDLSYKAILKRQEDFRAQLAFNPEFVGRITSMNMILADIVWEEFVEPALKETRLNPESEEAKLNLLKAKKVYNFFINIVQKQLSQIPIAAKNTDASALDDFREMMSNLSDLANYESYEKFVSTLDPESKDFDEMENSLNSYAKFISVTGWDQQHTYGKDLVSFEL